MPLTIGILHPGAMGSSVGACARQAGARVCWVSEGRSAATRARARIDHFVECARLDELTGEAEILFSICPPRESERVARAALDAGFSGLFVDANAIDPEKARRIARMARDRGAGFVDGGIVGPPARQKGSTVLYLSGEPTPVRAVAGIFEDTPLETIVLEGGIGRASALKMAYAAYTKGNVAMLLAIRALARAEGVEDALLGHWQRTHPDLESAVRAAAKRTAAKAWRFEGEMEEIADTFRNAGLPAGFHEAAADIYGRLADFRDGQAPDLEEVLERLLPDARRKA